MFPFWIVCVSQRKLCFHKISNNRWQYNSFHGVLSFPKLFYHLVTSVANNEVDESFSISINSNPNPTEVFFEPI